MDHTQFIRFQKITLDYFTKLAPEGDAPTLETPYLLIGDPLALDYTALVRIRGEYDGCLYFTAPREMVLHILQLHGEELKTQEALEDMSRELSNILAGNASHAFGENWKISVPESLQRDRFAAEDMPQITFVLPIRWRGLEGFLVVGLREHEPVLAENAV